MVWTGDSPISCSQTSTMSTISLPIIDLDVFLRQPQESEAVVSECKKVRFQDSFSPT